MASPDGPNLPETMRHLSASPLAQMPTINRISNSLSCGISLCLNTLLIYLIARKSTREMRVYSRILLMTCITDLCYSLILFVTMPISTVIDGNHIILQIGYLFPRGCPGINEERRVWLDFTLVMLWALVFMYHVNALPMQYVYRYLILCW